MLTRTAFIQEEIFLNENNGSSSKPFNFTRKSGDETILRWVPYNVWHTLFCVKRDRFYHPYKTRTKALIADASNVFMT